MHRRKDAPRTKAPGLVGLRNIGNTCFVNSCLQVLFHTPEFNEFVKRGKTKMRMNSSVNTVMLQEYVSLHDLMFSLTESNVIVSPNKFIHTLHSVAQTKGLDLFSGFNQNDLPEFLMFLIDCFHNSLSREVVITIKQEDQTVLTEYDKVAVQCYEMIRQMYSKEYSEILDFFHGIHVNIIMDKNTGELIRSIPEPFFMINLPVVNPFSPQISPSTESVTLLQCFDWYISKEMLEGDNAFKRDDGTYAEASKQIVFWGFPRILVLDLKRFNARNQKNQCLVTFPLSGLNLTDYVIGYDKESFVYDLYGVCNHSGNVHGGHYTCFVKCATSKQWYHFNDTMVTLVESPETTIISPQAYCLFYRKREALRA